MATEHFLIVVMGVAASGKLTIGDNLAKVLGFPFIDGDSLHPESNVDKMSRGEPLTDKDREPWLKLCRSQAETTESRGLVLACSALKKYYRDILRGAHIPSTSLHPESEVRDLPARPASPPAESVEKGVTKITTYFVYIDGDRKMLEERMGARKGHFMKASMLNSQLSTLENPAGEDRVVVVPLADTVENQVAKAAEELRALGVEAS